jgi:hypothetical protein
MAYFVPAIFRINWSGISRGKAVMASNPVQWVGTMQSGRIALISAIVFWIGSGLAQVKWNPPKEG